MRAERRRILVVDDDEKLGRTMMRALAVDHDVVVLGRVQDALDTIMGGERFDLILCDLMMPGLGAIELHEQLVAVAPVLVGRVAVITGGAFTPRAAAFLSRTSIPTLEKPFTLAELRDFVAGHMERAASGP